MKTSMRTTWDLIENWLRTHAPQVLDSLRPGATDEQIAAIEDCVKRHSRRGLSREELLALDTELHRRIVEASGNELLVNA